MIEGQIIKYDDLLVNNVLNALKLIVFMMFRLIWKKTKGFAPSTSDNCKYIMLMSVDVKTLKMARKSVKLQKENPAGYAGEGKQSKGKYYKRKDNSIM